MFTHQLNGFIHKHEAHTMILIMLINCSILYSFLIIDFLELLLFVIAMFVVMAKCIKCVMMN